MAGNNNFIKLSALAHNIESVIKDAFSASSFWVIADVTNHTHKASSNYHYFELVEKEEGSNHIVTKFSAKAWGSGARSLDAFEQITGQRFTNNIHVLVNVVVEYHPQFGLQLQVIGIEASYTLGMIEKQRQQTLARLVAENPDTIRKVGDTYVTRNRGLRLKPVLQNIAVISSKSSAGLLDFKHTLAMNAWGYQFSLHEFFTEVQGDANAISLRNILIHIYNSHVPYDAVCIIRGGGAQTDFLLFDNYLVGQAIAKFPIPVITGIGHQHNTSIADLMAHTQTKTPTEAAGFIIAHNRAFEEQLLHFQKNILIKSQQLFAAQLQALNTLKNKIAQESRVLLTAQKDDLQHYQQLTVNNAREVLFSHRSSLLGISSRMLSKPTIILSNKRNDLKNITNNFRSYNAAYLKSKKGELAHYVSVINLVSPESILRRGFAIIKQGGRVLGSAAALKTGDDISIILSDAELSATITKKDNYDETTFKL